MRRALPKKMIDCQNCDILDVYVIQWQLKGAGRGLNKDHYCSRKMTSESLDKSISGDPCMRKGR